SASATTDHTDSQQPTTAPDAVAAAGMASDVRLEITQNKSITGFIYKLIDKKSGDVVRQWPTEQMVKMREYLAEQQIQLVDEKA
ncbi:MAG TPA: flagellar protein FlaG, partial [Rhizomicrobium sp.]